MHGRRRSAVEYGGRGPEAGAYAQEDPGAQLAKRYKAVRGRGPCVLIP